MSPSPMRAENHRSTSVRTPLTTAITATSSDRRTTTAESLGSMPSSMRDFRISGVATTSAESMTTSPRNHAICTL